MAYKTDYDRMIVFQAMHTPSENAIYDEIHRADILHLIWDADHQQAEYVTYTEDFLSWWKNHPEPTFDQVKDILYSLFDGMILGQLDETQMRHLAAQICAIIYDQEPFLA